MRFLQHFSLILKVHKATCAIRRGDARRRADSLSMSGSCGFQSLPGTAIGGDPVDVHVVSFRYRINYSSNSAEAAKAGVR